MQIQLEWDGMAVPIASPSWQGLVHSANSFFQGLPNQFDVFYEDEEGDRITVANQTGMDEAIRWAMEHNVQALYLTINVPVPEDDSSSVESGWHDIKMPLANSPQSSSSTLLPPPVSVGPPAMETQISTSSSLPPTTEEEPMWKEVIQEEATHDALPVVESDGEETTEEEEAEEQQVGEEEEQADHVTSVLQTAIDIADNQQQQQQQQQQEEECIEQDAPVESPSPCATEQTQEEEDDMPELRAPMRSRVDVLETTIDRLLTDPAVPTNIVDLAAAAATDDTRVLTHNSNNATMATPPPFVVVEEDDDIDEEVANLVNKVLTPPRLTEPVDAVNLVLRVAANKQAVDFIAQSLQNHKLANAITSAAAAELQQSGEGVKLAKMRVLTQFSQTCARLAKLAPEFEPLLLSMLGCQAPPQLVEHKKVMCDRCQVNAEAAAESVAAGCRNPATHYICGVRYKSATKADFDLCDLCEASMEFQASHGPFLKIVNPEEAPAVILCAMGNGENDGEFNFESHLELESQPVLAKEFADFLEFRKNKPAAAAVEAPPAVVDTPSHPPPPPEVPVVVVSAPPPPVVEADATPSSVVASSPLISAPPAAPAPVVLAPPPTVRVTPVEKPKCKHTLKTFTPLHSGFHCDQCHMRVPPKTTLHGCRMCNFDLCDACFNLVNNNSNNSQPITNPVIVTPAAPKAPSMPQAKFVCDVTLADGCMVRPGEHLDKTWRVRNSGEDVWPAGTKICHVGGDRMGGPIYGKEVPLNVRPGEAVNLSIDLIMPTVPGRYTSYWRLTTPHPQNARFGHRFWVTVNVVPVATATTVPGFPSFVRPPPPPAPPLMIRAPQPPQPPPPPAAPAPNALEMDDEFAMSVAQIVDFGFTDMDKIVAVLREENGDTGRAIDRLLAEEQN